jgi:hypothetical protein
LHTTLGAEPGVNYPIIRVYICMKFAMNQPAPSGSIVVHCGGKSNSPFLENSYYCYCTYFDIKIWY